MRNNRLLTLTALAFAVATAATHAGKMYQCRSADGSVEFSNVACSDDQANRATVMRLQDRQPGEQSSSDMVERSQRFSEQRRTWAEKDRAATGQPQYGGSGQQPLTYGQRQAIKNANVGRPAYDNRLTPAENAAAANAHNAKARGVLSGAGLNPNDYVKDQEVILPPPRPNPPASSAPQYVPTVNKWCQQQGGILNCW